MARKATVIAVPSLAPVLGPAPEIVRVHTQRVACDGVGGALGHPRVWVDLGESGTADCGYCDRRFVLSQQADHTPGVYESSGGH